MNAPTIVSVAMASAWPPGAFFWLTGRIAGRYYSASIVGWVIGTCVVFTVGASLVEYEIASGVLKVVLILCCGAYLLTAAAPHPRIGRWRLAPGFATSILVIAALRLAEVGSPLLYWVITVGAVALLILCDVVLTAGDADRRRMAAADAEEQRLRQRRFRAETEHQRDYLREREEELRAEIAAGRKTKYEAAALKSIEKLRAEARAKGLEGKAIYGHNLRILKTIYSSAGGLVGAQVGLVEVCFSGESYADVWVVATRLEQLGFVLIKEKDSTSWTDTLELTREGAQYLYADSGKGPGLLMTGDTFNVGPGAIFINRSSLHKSMNRLKNAYGGEAATTLEKLAQAVDESNSKDAAENFDQFNKELQTTAPRKSILKSLFQGVLAAAPAVSELADSVDKVISMFE